MHLPYFDEIQAFLDTCIIDAIMIIIMKNTKSGIIWLGLFRIPNSPCSSSAYSAPSKKATIPIYKVLVRPDRESTPDLPTSNHRLVKNKKCITTRYGC